LWWLNVFTIAKVNCNQIFSHDKVYNNQSGLSSQSPIRLFWAVRRCL
jgi:hypothetical protein